MGRVAPFAISGALLGALAWFVDWGEFARLFSTERLAPLLLGGALFAATLVLRGVRFAMLFSALAGKRFDPLGGIEIAAVGNFGNHLLPMRLGELVFVFLATGAKGVPGEGATVSLVTARLYDLTGLCLVLATAGAIFAAPGAPAVAWGLAGASAVLVIVAARMDLALAVGHRIAMALLGVLGLESRPRLRRVHGFFVQMERAIGEVRRPSLAAANLAFSVAIWMTLVACFHALLVAFGHPMPFLHVAVGSAGATLSGLLPVNAVGSLGTLEAGWAAGFVPLGMEPADAAATGVAMHVVVIVVSGIAAGLAALRIGPESFRGLGEWRRRRARTRGVPGDEATETTGAANATDTTDTTDSTTDGGPASPVSTPTENVEPANG